MLLINAVLAYDGILLTVNFHSVVTYRKDLSHLVQCTLITLESLRRDDCSHILNHDS